MLLSGLSCLQQATPTNRHVSSAHLSWPVSEPALSVRLPVASRGLMMGVAAAAVSRGSGLLGNAAASVAGRWRAHPNRRETQAR